MYSNGSVKMINYVMLTKQLAVLKAFYDSTFQ